MEIIARSWAVFSYDTILWFFHDLHVWSTGDCISDRRYQIKFWKGYQLLTHWMKLVRRQNSWICQQSEQDFKKIFNRNSTRIKATVKLCARMLNMTVIPWNDLKIVGRSRQYVFPVKQIKATFPRSCTIMGSQSKSKALGWNMVSRGMVVVRDAVVTITHFMTCYSLDLYEKIFRSFAGGMLRWWKICSKNRWF